MDASDLFDVYASDDAVARARADAMAQRARGLQGAGLMLDTLTGGRIGAGKVLTGQGQHEQDQVAQAIRARPEAMAQNVAARRAQEEADAWKDPASAGLLRGAIRQFMPNLPLDENTPTPVLRNIMPIAEKFGQSYNALALRQMGQDRLKAVPLPGGGAAWQHPITWAVYEMGPNGEVGRMISPPRRNAPGMPGAVPGAPGPLRSAPPAPDGSQPPDASIPAGPPLLKAPPKSGRAPVAGTPASAGAPAPTGDATSDLPPPRNPAERIAQDILAGRQPPDLKNVGRAGVMVKDAIARYGGNLAQLQNDWTATQKHLASMNSNQQLRLAQSAHTALESIDNIEKIYKEWEDLGGASDFPILNKGSLAMAKQLPGRKGEVARALETNIADLTSELGNVYQGGNSPTIEALRLAATSTSAGLSPGQFRESMKQARKNIGYRINAMGLAGVAGASAGNKYGPRPAEAAAPAAGEPTGAAAPVVDKRAARQALAAQMKSQGKGAAEILAAIKAQGLAE